jgi:hypothetical protein
MTGTPGRACSRLRSQLASFSVYILQDELRSAHAPACSLFNIPVTGEPVRIYPITHGVSVDLEHTRLFGIPLSIGFQGVSYDGGLTFEDPDLRVGSGGYSASSDEGLGFEIGLGVGVSVSHLENLLNLFIPCAQ